MASIAQSWNKLMVFLTETRSEMKKVTFPPRNEVVGTTVVVLIACVVFAIFLWFSDLVILRVYEAVLRFIGS